MVRAAEGRWKPLNGAGGGDGAVDFSSSFRRRPASFGRSGCIFGLPMVRSTSLLSFVPIGARRKMGPVTRVGRKPNSGEVPGYFYKILKNILSVFHNYKSVRRCTVFKLKIPEVLTRSRKFLEMRVRTSI